MAGATIKLVSDPQSKRKKRRRRRRKFKPSIVKITSPDVIPDRLMVKLPYASSANFNSTGINKWTVSGNSVFDPDVTFTGHQPKGFDTYSSLYDTYRVTASKIKVWVVNNSSAGVLFGLTASKTDDTYSTLTDFLETPYTNFKCLPGNAGGGTEAVNMYMKTSKVLGLKDSASNEDIDASVSGNPSERWYYLLQMSDIVSPATAIDVDILYEVIYYVEFFGRKKLAQS